MDMYGIFHDATLYQILPFLFLYIGPETILPLTSALAAVVGVLLMFWQRFLALVQKIWRLIVRREA
jgi:hypothetical protein